MYNELGPIKEEEGLLAFENKLIDRFGALPKEAKALLNSIRIKWIATQFRVEKLMMKQGKIICYFVSDQQSAFYASPNFHKVLEFIQKHSNICKMKEKQTHASAKSKEVQRQTQANTRLHHICFFLTAQRP